MDIDNEKMNVTEEVDAASAQTEIDEQTWREISGGEPDGEPEPKPEYTVEYILSRMEAIRKDTAHINAALEAFVNFTPNLAPDGGHGDAERSKAILEVVKSHEIILEKELNLLERMYDNLTNIKESNKARVARSFIADVTLPPNCRMELIQSVLDTIED